MAVIQDLVVRTATALADPLVRADRVAESAARRPLLAELALRDVGETTGDDSPSERVKEIEDLLGMGTSISGTDFQTRLFDRYAGGVAPSPSPTAILVIAGPACGKGPIVEQLCRELAGYGHAVVVDVAEIAWLTPAAWLGEIDAVACRRSAIEHASRLVERAIATRQNLVVELRQCSVETAALALRFLQAGYDLALLVPDTPDEEVVRRSDARRAAWHAALGDRVVGLSVVESGALSKTIDFSEVLRHLSPGCALWITPDGVVRPFDCVAGVSGGVPEVVAEPRQHSIPVGSPAALPTAAIVAMGKQRGVKIGNFAANKRPLPPETEPRTAAPESEPISTRHESAVSQTQIQKSRGTKLGSFVQSTKRVETVPEGANERGEPSVGGSVHEAVATPPASTASSPPAAPTPPPKSVDPLEVREPPLPLNAVSSEVIEKRRRLVRKIREWASNRGG